MSAGAHIFIYTRIYLQFSMNSSTSICIDIDKQKTEFLI